MKRPREAGDDDGTKRARPAAGRAASASAAPGAGAAAGATIGQQTSHIKNKLVRSETYAKLKHKQKVRGTGFLSQCVWWGVTQSVCVAAYSPCHARGPTHYAFPCTSFPLHHPGSSASHCTLSVCLSSRLILSLCACACECRSRRRLRARSVRLLRPRLRSWGWSHHQGSSKR